MPSDTNVLMADARCIQQCVPGTDMKLAVLISLFAKIAAVSTDTNSLIDGAKCIQQCIPEGMKLAVLISLASQIAGASGNGVSAGNGAPTSSTPGNLYVQWDSVPPNQVWIKGSDGIWV